MSDMTVSVLLRLVDKLSGPAQKATAGLKGIATGAKAIVPAANAAGRANDSLARSLGNAGRQGQQAASGINRAATASSTAAGHADRAAAAFKRMGAAATAAFAKLAPPAGIATVENYAKAQEKLHARMSRAQSGLFGGAMAGGAVAYPLKRASDYELAMTRFGNIANYGDGEFATRLSELNKRFRGDAGETRQYASDILAGVENLIARGMDQSEALGGSKLIGKAATATGTANEDLSNMYYALRQNLGIDEKSMPKAFDIATQAGKLGGFELKDMAKWFPELTVGYSAMGIKGDEAGQKALARLSAMLQVAREGAATPDKAANNLANVLQKLTLKETRKNFEKTMGIDFAKEMQGAVEKGEDPIMHLLGLVDEFMKKNDDNIFMLGDLFADRQALDALRALIVKREKIDEITRKTLEAEDVINRDFDRVSRTFAMRWKGMLIAADNLANTIMTGPLGEGKGILGGLEDVFKSLDGMAQRHPTITGALMNVGIGLLGFSLAAKAFSFVASGIKLGALGLAGLFWKFNDAGKNVAFFSRALRGLRMGAGAFAGLFAGVGLGLARLAKLSRFIGVGGVLMLGLKALARFTLVGTAIWGATEIISNWETISSSLEGIWTRMAETWERLKKGYANPEEVEARRAKMEEERQAAIAADPDQRTWWQKLQDPSYMDGVWNRFINGPDARLPRERVLDGPLGTGGEWEPVNTRMKSRGYKPASGAAVDAQTRGIAGSDMPATAAANAQPAIMGAATAPITINAQGPQVTFNQAPPTITVNAPITINMAAADPGAVGGAVSAHLNKVARGALHDGVGE
jgi:TP901 family phage tail tape measure protein